MLDTLAGKPTFFRLEVTHAKSDLGQRNREPSALPYLLKRRLEADILSGRFLPNFCGDRMFLLIP
jgi:hypothetical protein